MSAGGALSLPGSLTIKEVRAERLRLAAALECKGPVSIDVSPLVAVDTAGIQLLLALKLDGERRGAALRFDGESAALSAALALLGLGAALGPGETHD